MRDLLQEGRDIQQNFKNRILETNSINEESVEDIFNTLVEKTQELLSTKEDQIAKFLDIEKMQKENPEFSLDSIKKEVDAMVKNFNSANQQTNEGISDIISFIKEKGKALINDLQSIKKAFSMLTNGAKFLKYIKDPIGLFRFLKNELKIDSNKTNEAGLLSLAAIFPNLLLILAPLFIVYFMWDRMSAKRVISKMRKVYNGEMGQPKSWYDKKADLFIKLFMKDGTTYDEIIYTFETGNPRYIKMGGSYNAAKVLMGRADKENEWLNWNLNIKPSRGWITANMVDAHDIDLFPRLNYTMGFDDWKKWEEGGLRKPFSPSKIIQAILRKAKEKKKKAEYEKNSQLSLNV